MRRRLFRWVLPALAAVFAAVPGCLGQRPEAKPFTVVPVSAGVWMLTGEGGNIALAVGSDTTLLVDTDYARSAPGLAEAIRGLTQRPVHYVLDTHWHADHAEGNAALAAAGAVIVAQENTRARLSTEQVMRGHHFPPPPPAARPTISFRDSFTLHLGGANDALVTWVGPAHTDGDVIVYFRKANVIHTGDLTCYYAYPFFDEESGADIRGMVTAVDRIAALANDSTRIIGGHGPLATRADLLQYRDMLRTIVGRVAEQKAAGRTVAQVIASKPTAEFDARWARPGTMPADTLVALIYRNLRPRPGA